MVTEFSHSVITRNDGRKRKPKELLLTTSSLMYNLYTPVCVLTYLYTHVFVPVLVLKRILKYSDICSFVILVFE